MPTAWSTSGSLLSDRIPVRPPPPRQQQRPNKGKGKGKGKGRATPTLESLPKSEAVRVLEARLEGARRSDGRSKDPRGGCFCQARKHALSSYVPICRRCGLVLCTLNPPYCACPHCASALLDGRAGREALVGRLEGELAVRVAQEEAERRRMIEEARAAEGAFPALSRESQTPTPVQTMGASRATPPPPATRKVISLNTGTKGVRVSSYMSRSASQGQDREDEAEDEEGRVPGPPREVGYVTEPPDPERPWKSVRAGDVRYVPVPASTETSGTRRQGQRKRETEQGAASTVRAGE